MIGMMYKDVLVLKRQMGYYGFFFVLYTALAAVGVFPPAVLPGLVVFIALMLPMSAFAYDEQARWEKFAASTPAGRGGMVGGRSLFVLFSVAVSSAAVLALMAVLTAIRFTPDAFSMKDGVFILLSCIAVALILDAVILPLLVKFGAEKSRLISVILFLAVLGTVVGVGQLAQAGSLPALPGWFSRTLPGLLAILAAGGFSLSYCISRHICARKAL